MSTSLKNLLKRPPIGSVTTTLGDLKIYAVNLRAMQILATTDAIDSLTFVREFSRQVCVPSGLVSEMPPAGPVLTVEQVNQLKTQDLLAIANAYLDADTTLAARAPGEDPLAALKRLLKKQQEEFAQVNTDILEKAFTRATSATDRLAGC